jgi:hypothetical protein
MPELSLSEAYNVLRPLGLLVVEIAIYSIFIFKFYRFLASRDIIKVDYSRYRNAGVRFIRWIGYLLQSIFLLPIVVFFWFAILAVFLGFLGKNQTTESILLVSIALVSAVRVAAYYNSDLARDLAKMLPFALLGIYLVDQSYFELSVSLELLTRIPESWTLLIYYFAFIIVLEFVLRILYNIVSLSRKKKEPSPAAMAPGNHREEGME